jgi:hypothetical protein
VSKYEIFDRSDFHKTDCKHCLEQLHEQSADGEQAQLDKDGADGGVHLWQLHSRQPRRLEPTGAVVSSKKKKLFQSAVKNGVFGPLRKMFYLTLDYTKVPRYQDFSEN